MPVKLFSGPVEYQGPSRHFLNAIRKNSLSQTARGVFQSVWRQLRVRTIESASAYHGRSRSMPGWRVGPQGMQEAWRMTDAATLLQPISRGPGGEDINVSTLYTSIFG